MSKVNQPRIVYFGYGDIGCHCLESLLKADIDVAGVMCRASDRAPGGGPTSLCARASGRGLRIFTHLAPKEPGFLDVLREIAPDYLVSIQYDRILPDAVLQTASVACLNLHFAPLPRLRGCFPTKWAIINNEDAGVTLHYMDPGIDTGTIVDQEIVPLAERETDRSLYLRVVEAGKRVFDRNVAGIANRSVPRGTEQDESQSSYYPKKTPFGGRIPWADYDAEWIERFIRAFTFPPHPGALASCNDLEYEFRGPLAVDAHGYEDAPGTIVDLDEERIGIACLRGRLLVDRVWQEGSAIIGNELMNHFAVGMRFE